MKKTLLSLLALLPLAYASAATLGPKHLPQIPSDHFQTLMIETTELENNLELRPKALASAEDSSEAGDVLSINYSPAESPYMAIGFNNSAEGDIYGMAFQMTKANANLYAGNQLTAVNFYTGMNKATNTNLVTNYTIFITEDLTKAPVYTQDFTVTNANAYSLVSVELDEPYTIEANKTFYVCVSFTLTSPYDYAIPVDYINHDGDVVGGWVGYYDPDGNEWTWQNIASSYGFVCVGATIAGENMPQNRFDVIDYAAPTVVYQNEEFSFQVLLQNSGANPITSLEVEYTIGTNQTVTSTLIPDTAVPYNGYYVLGASELSYDSASATPIPLNVTISKVNGNENQATNKQVNTTLLVLPEGKGYKKNIVVEEMTGTWCGYCPTGYTVMEEIYENFPYGDIIPVCVHVNGSTGTEPMYASSFAGVASMVSGVPSALLNREVAINPWPYDYVIEACEEIASVPAVGQIELEVSPVEGNDKQLLLKATTEFTFDLEDASDRYAISFAITEDNVGPYTQTNYYAGETGDYLGWESKPSSVSLMYNSVARQLNNYSGLANSIPESVTAATPYTFEYTASLSSKIKDVNNINVVAYLLDKKSGTIENAATVKHPVTSGVEAVEISSKNNAPVEYFNLQGMRVENPSAGVYIRRQGSEVSKVLVR